jgi:hypothetical protein
MVPRVLEIARRAEGSKFRTVLPHTGLRCRDTAVCSTDPKNLILLLRSIRLGVR